MNSEFKTGQLVKIIGDDPMIVKGAMGTITNIGIGSIEVLWGGMSAFKADHKYRNGFDEILTTDVSPNSIKVVSCLSPWAHELKKEFCIDDCVKYVGETTKNYKHGDLFCVYAMDYSKHILQCIKLDNYTLYTLNTSDCILEGPHCAIKQGTKVTAIRDAAYVEVGKTGYIRATDYRTSLPYLVRWDDSSESWVAACTIARTVSDISDVIAEEFGTEMAKESPVDPVLENGFSGEVTFYEKD